MSKKIKLLEENIKKITKTQLKMQREMESLIKKNVRRATKPLIKKLGEAASKFEKAFGDQEKVQRMVNPQHAQYDELRKVVEVTTKHEEVPVILNEQADMIDELKSRVKDKQEHVTTQSTWQLAADRDISLLPTIKENQETLMLNVLEIVNFLANDAKKGKLKKSAPKKKPIVPAKQVSASMPIAPRGPSPMADRFNASKAVLPAKETFQDFAPLSKEEYERRFKGLNDVNFSERKSQEAWRRERGIHKGQRIELKFYTSINLAPWCYEPNWTNEKIFKWMKNRNQRLKEKKEAGEKKLDAKRRFKTLRLRTADEFTRSNYV